MATETTYKYSAGSEAGTYWDNDSNAWDGDIDTRASRTIPKNSGKETDKWIKGTTNTAPSSSGNISKVEVGFTTYMDNFSFIIGYLVPIFSGSVDGDEHNFTLSTSKVTYYVDITNDNNAPGSWTWADVQNLDLKYYGENTNALVTGDAHIYQFYVRVTSSTGPTPSSTKLHYTLGTPNSSLDSDNFNDNSLDSTNWTSYTYDSGAINEQNQRLELSETSGGDAAIYQMSVSGDFDVSVKIINSDYPDRCGILFGNDLESNRYIDCYVELQDPSHYVTGYIKSSSGSGSSSDTAPSFPFWIRIKRIGSTGYTYHSTNGTNWTLLNSGSTYNTDHDIYIYIYHFSDSNSHYGYFDDFVNRDLLSTTDINIYESECGSDGTSCMTYSLQTCNDGTNVNYCQITTNLSHADMSKLRVRKGGVTYGVLKVFDVNE